MQTMTALGAIATCVLLAAITGAVWVRATRYRDAVTAWISRAALIVLAATWLLVLAYVLAHTSDAAAQAHASDGARWVIVAAAAVCACAASGWAARRGTRKPARTRRARSGQ